MESKLMDVPVVDAVAVVVVVSAAEEPEDECLH